MTNQETNVTNYYESQLASTLSSGASSATVTSASGSPATPFYMVVDADDSSNFWVALVTNKSGTTFTLGSAAPRTFDAGTEVGCYPVAELWTDINDRVEGHQHGGGTDGAAVATSDLTGHDKAAHDALNINADQVDGNDAADLLARANHTGTQAISTLSDHNKAAHDALTLDHGSLSGRSDVSDHPQYVQCLGVVAETGGGQSISAGVDTTLTLDEDKVTTNCSLASNTLTVTYGGEYIVHVDISGSSSSGASSGTLRFKVNGSTVLSSSVTAGGAGFSGLIGSSARFTDAVKAATLSDGDDLTVTLQLTGGSGHSIDDALLAIEKVG